MNAPLVRERWDEIAARLHDAGHPPPTAPPPIARAHEPEMPWFVKGLVGLGAWLSALFLIGFVSLSLGAGLVALGFLLFGLLLLAAGCFSLRLSRGVFLDQVGLAITLAGQALLVKSVLEQGASVTAAALVEVITAAAVIAVVPTPVSRFLATVAGAASLGVALVNAPVPWPLDCLSLLLAGAAGWLWQKQPARLGRTGQDGLAPIAFGLTVVLFGALTVATLPRAYLLSDVPPLGHLASAGLGLGAVFLALTVRQELKLGRPDLLAGGGMAALAVLGAATPGAPGLAAALAALLMAIHRRNPILLGLAIVFLVGFLAAFYYALSATLLVKALHLIGAGGLLLGAAVAIRWRRPR